MSGQYLQTRWLRTGSPQEAADRFRLSVDTEKAANVAIDLLARPNTRDTVEWTAALLRLVVAEKHGPTKESPHIVVVCTFEQAVGCLGDDLSKLDTTLPRMDFFVRLANPEQHEALDLHWSRHQLRIRRRDFADGHGVEASSFGPEILPVTRPFEMGPVVAGEFPNDETRDENKDIACLLCSSQYNIARAAVTRRLPTALLNDSICPMLTQNGTLDAGLVCPAWKPTAQYGSECRTCDLLQRCGGCALVANRTSCAVMPAVRAALSSRAERHSKARDPRLLEHDWDYIYDDE